MTFEQHLIAGPTWVLIWVMILGLVNFGAIAFVRHDVRPRWVLAAMLPNLLLMNFMFNVFGYTRILGLPHVLIWTPLLVYLFLKRRPEDRRTWTGRYLYLVMVVNATSLLFDYSDVIRYWLGEPGVVA